MVYRPFGSVDFHAAAGIPAFRIQRVKWFSPKTLFSSFSPYAMLGNSVSVACYIIRI